MDKTLLIIGLIFPEPEATAAGSRMLQLIQYFQHQKYKLVFASTAGKSDKSLDFNKFSIPTKDILLNDSSFDDWVKDLQPDYVLFDRFITEEQFGWRIQENCPKAMRILDTEDLHFLRKVREEALKKENYSFSDLLNSDIAKREVASMYRCDLSLIISDYEAILLVKQFHIDPSLIIYLPFLTDAPRMDSLQKLPSYSQRQHFISVGNFKHKPNKDAVLFLKKVIWPMIRNKLPLAELHVFGAYGNDAVNQLNNKREGFLIKGWAPDIHQELSRSRVCLAPLRFGAGLKGKLIDSMYNGTPNITTDIGAEGMKGLLPWSGFIENDPESFAQKAIQIYTDKTLWEKAQLHGISILQKRFDKDKFYTLLSDRINQIASNLSEHRSSNFIGAMLNYHGLQSTKYLSKWIEAKNASPSQS